MTVLTAKDPIASDIGHGQMGLRSGLRLLTTLIQESDSQKHAFAELRGSKLLVPASWSVHAGSVYKISVDEVFNGRRLDVIGLRRAAETLTRVETLAGVIAGTYYFDADASAASFLYARLSDSSSPANVSVLATFGFYFGSTRVVQPTLGPDKVVDGGFEVWTNPTTLTNWSTTLVGSGTGSVNQATALAPGGSYSCRIDASLTPGSDFVAFTPVSDIPAVTGARYRYEGLYSTPAGMSQYLTACIGARGAAAGTPHIAEDGRTYSASQVLIALAPTNGEVRRFSFDFIAPDVALGLRVRLACSGAAASGSVYFDDVKLRRIYRFEEHDPRISYDSLPEISEGRKGIFYDRWQLGQGALSLLNGYAHLEGLFGSYEFTNATCYIRIGGRFPDGGNEILIEDMLVRRWLMRRVIVRDTEVVIDLDDPRQLFLERLPRRTYTPDEFPDMAEVDRGKVRPLAFGEPLPGGSTGSGAGGINYGIRMARVDKNAKGYGVHELFDPLYIVATAASGTDTGYSYPDDTAANKLDQSKALFLTYGVTGHIISTGAATGQYEITADIQHIEIVAGKNDLLDFDEGGGALVATIAPGRYNPEGDGVTLDEVVDTALSAAGAGSYTVTYNQTTHKFTITKSAGTFNIRRTSAAPNRDRSAWTTMGFSDKVDLTGALAYTAETALFTDCDAQHVWHTRALGYQDDASQTYTGTVGGYIKYAGDIYYFLLRKVLGVPAEQVDLASLAAARSSAEPLNVFIGVQGTETLEFGEIVERIENSSGVELLMDGDRWVMRRRDNSTPSGIVELFDRDILDFSAWYDEADMASVVVVSIDQNPRTGNYPAMTLDENSANGAVALTCAKTKTRLGRDKRMEFLTYLPTGASAVPIEELFTNAASPRRRVLMTVKTRCLKIIPGDKLKISRGQFVARTDAAPSMVVRVLSVSHNLQSWESTLECAEVLTQTREW